MRPQSTSAFSQFVFAFAFLFSVIAVTTPLAHAQTFSVVHDFTGGNGGVPFNGLTVGAGGGGGSHSTAPGGHGQSASFYGTTSTGGSSNDGVVFSMNPSGAETIIHNFTGGTDGAGPYGVLIIDKAGNLYGTTTAGGSADAGTVFEVSGNAETVLYSFAGGANGADPIAGLVEDAAGNLYGTTSQGGTNGNGTVFELAIPKTKGAPWTQSVLYSFGAGTDGSVPIGGVNFDSAGNLYGTTSSGGAYGYGIVFQLVPGARWTENILHSFQNGNDGSVPYAGLIADKSGNFYGAATQGGANGGGTVYELIGSGSNWNFSVIYSVPGWGISGTFRNVVLDSSGNLYGTTHCDGSYSAGTVYELSPSGGNWKYSLLYTFTGGSDGQYSVANLVSSQNKLYGTTLYGGSNNNGVVYEVTP
jgi:uncharacterized repeat protein (TIGR03803 family)